MASILRTSRAIQQNLLAAVIAGCMMPSAIHAQSNVVDATSAEAVLKSLEAQTEKGTIRLSGKGHVCIVDQYSRVDRVLKVRGFNVDDDIRVPENTVALVLVSSGQTSTAILRQWPLVFRNDGCWEVSTVEIVVEPATTASGLGFFYAYVGSTSQ
ncbi:hypothetical protein D1114_21070 [Cereibacter sphaeroides]|uniref:Uncharacterized protein n=1 Tax=Cereibacter sphaeroides TaxID=1063 RepID=A0AAX1UGD7_CERSP|nr:hypothetical protein [Cereibacter sphaeroides]RHZ91163.1 hypothetical protein D1114_21070 [Cereibacter sphaeroides]